MASITIELTTNRPAARSRVANILWTAIQKVSDDLASISMIVAADDPMTTVTTVAAVAATPNRADLQHTPTPDKAAKRRARAKRRKARGDFAQLAYRPSGAGSRFRKIEIEESLLRNAMTLPQLMGMTTRRGTWQNALKMASLTTSAGRWAKTNGDAAVAAV